MMPPFSLILIDRPQSSGTHYYVTSLKIKFSCLKIILIDCKRCYKLFNNDIIHFKNLSFRVCIGEQVSELPKYASSMISSACLNTGVVTYH